MTSLQDRILPTDTPAEGVDAYATDEERRIASEFVRNELGRKSAGWLIFYRGETRVLLIRSGKSRYISLKADDGTYTKPVQVFDYPEA